MIINNTIEMSLPNFIRGVYGAHNFYTPQVFDALSGWLRPVRISWQRLVARKLELWAIRGPGANELRQHVGRFDTTPRCHGRTERQTDKRTQYRALYSWM